jgi:anti-sigma factor RsiW
MTGGRRFSLSSPDWGQDHLSLDAIVAYVDDELAPGAHDRAEAHLARCADCRAEVLAQLQARSLLRGAGAPDLPSSLLRSLRSIPVEAELPPPPPGLGITADGQFVLLRDAPQAAPGSERGAAHDIPSARPGPEPDPGGKRRFSRRARIGAVSGLAFGALAVGALAVPGPAAPDASGVVGGDAVRNVPIQARLTAGPAVSPAVAGGVRPVATPAVADTTGTGAPADATSAGDSVVIDARLRAQLDRLPIAFYSTP